MVYIYFYLNMNIL